MATVTNITQGNASIGVGGDLGYIEGPVVLAVTSDMYYARAEGINANLHARNVNQNYEMRATLLEPTMANMQIAYDWQNSSASASGSEDALDFGGENFNPTIRHIAIYGYVPGSGLYTRTIEAERAIAIPGSEISWGDAEATKLPVAFSLLYDTTDSRCGQMLDATS